MSKRVTLWSPSKYSAGCVRLKQQQKKANLPSCRCGFLLEEFHQERHEDAWSNENDEHQHTHHHRVHLHVSMNVQLIHRNRLPPFFQRKQVQVWLCLSPSTYFDSSATAALGLAHRVNVRYRKASLWLDLTGQTHRTDSMT